MQQMVSPPRLPINPNRSGVHSQSARPQSIIIAAITLFALSGLLIGFAVGALNRPKQTPTTTPNKGNTPIVAQKASPTVTLTSLTPSNLGCPYMNQYTEKEAIG